MPYFTMRLTVNQDWLNNMRALPERSQRNVRRAIQTQLKPDLQDQVKQLTPLDPGPSVHPFAFGTELSRKYYFWLITQNEDLTDGNSWKRHPDDPESVENAFQVEASDRLRGSLIKIFNNNSAGKWVYGPYQVSGFAATGWQNEAESMRQLLHEYAVGELRRLWRQALVDGLRGEG